MKDPANCETAPGDQWPNGGKVTIEWTVTTIQGQRRLGWSVDTQPDLDPKLTIALLRDVAAELEIDLP
jgi:hypothetical protein